MKVCVNVYLFPCFFSKRLILVIKVTISVIPRAAEKLLLDDVGQ